MFKYVNTFLASDFQFHMNTNEILNSQILTHLQVSLHSQIPRKRLQTPLHSSLFWNPLRSFGALADLHWRSLIP